MDPVQMMLPLGTLYVMNNYVDQEDPDQEATNLNFSNLVAGGIMYGSYFALFFQFFWKRFVVKARAEGKAKAL